MSIIEIQRLAIPGLISMALALALSSVVVRFIVSIGWLDKPNHRKFHEGCVPLAGGLLIMLSSAAVILGMHLWSPPSATLWVAALMLFVVAFIDDRYPVRARYRFTVQVAAATLVSSSVGWEVASLGQAIGPFELALGALALPFTVLGISALTNAVNMTDGIDGACGGMVVVAMFWLLVGFATIGVSSHASAALAEQAVDTARSLSVLIGSTIAFLVFNQRTPIRKKAEIFLGDGGSMMLGFLIAALCVHISSGYGHAGMPAAAVGWLVSVPLIDLFSCIVRRVIAGKTPMRPDRRHMQHLFLAMGFSVGRTAVILQALCFATGLIGYLGWHFGVPEYLMFWSLGVVLTAYFFGSLMLWKKLEPGTNLVGLTPEQDAEEEFATTIRHASNTTIRPPAAMPGARGSITPRSSLPSETRVGR